MSTVNRSDLAVTESRVAVLRSKGPLGAGRIFPRLSFASTVVGHRNGNTVVAGGAPRKVTKSLWRNILLIHVRLYNPAHFYSASRPLPLERAYLPHGVSLCADFFLSVRSLFSLFFLFFFCETSTDVPPRLNNYGFPANVPDGRFSTDDILFAAQIFPAIARIGPLSAACPN